MNDRNDYERRHGLPPLSLIALGQSMPESLCWRCFKLQNFYDSPCQHCGAINPNYDLDGALAQQDSSRIKEAVPQRVNEPAPDRGVDHE